MKKERSGRIVEKTPEEHATEVAQDFAQACRRKYMKGQDEHGGRLWRKPCWKFFEDEAVDIWVYFHVIREQLWKAIQISGKCKCKSCKEINNLLTKGNVEGKPEEEK